MIFKRIFIICTLLFLTLTDVYSANYKDGIKCDDVKKVNKSGVAWKAAAFNIQKAEVAATYINGSPFCSLIKKSDGLHWSLYHWDSSGNSRVDNNHGIHKDWKNKDKFNNQAMNWIFKNCVFPYELAHNPDAVLTKTWRIPRARGKQTCRISRLPHGKIHSD